MAPRLWLGPAGMAPPVAGVAARCGRGVTAAETRRGTGARTGRPGPVPITYAEQGGAGTYLAMVMCGPRASTPNVATVLNIPRATTFSPTAGSSPYVSTAISPVLSRTV